MATWREIERLRKNPDGFRALANALMASCGDALTEWEAAFLDGIVHIKHIKEFSSRQSEKLFEIRDNAETVETVAGFSVKRLVQSCYEARLDLSEEDEEWIAAVWQTGSPSIRRKHAVRLLRYSRQLGLIEDVA